MKLVMSIEDALPEADEQINVPPKKTPAQARKHLIEKRKSSIGRK